MFFVDRQLRSTSKACRMHYKVIFLHVIPVCIIGPLCNRRINVKGTVATYEADIFSPNCIVDLVDFEVQQSQYRAMHWVLLETIFICFDNTIDLSSNLRHLRTPA